MRLVEGHHRVSDARTERRTQARLGRFLDRRQPRHPHQAGICPQGRRHCARDADPGGRQRMEGAGLGMHRRQQRHHPYAVGQDHDLRQGGGSCGEARAAGRRQAEGSQGLEDHRQGLEAARHRRQDDRHDDLRHRRQAAGHAQRRDQGLPGVRRQAEELRRSQGHGHEGRQEGRAGQRQRASPSSPIPGGTPRPRSMRCRSSGTKARTPRSPASRSPNGWPKVSTMRSRPTSATRTATPRPPSPAPARRSRRSTTIPTRTTRRWSR